MAEGGGLENRLSERARGFESHPLRFGEVPKLAEGAPLERE